MKDKIMFSKVTFLKRTNCIEDAFTDIHTPYIVLCDDEQHAISSGVHRAVSFLDSHLDYVGCSGVIGGYRQSNLYEYWSMRTQPVNLEQPNASERILHSFREDSAYVCLAGGVFRTDVLRAIIQQSSNHSFINSDIGQMYIFSSLLLAGKIRYEDSFYIAFHKKSAKKREIKEEWARRVVCGSWMQELEVVIRLLTIKMHQDQLLVGVDQETFSMQLKQALLESKNRLFHSSYFLYIPIRERFLLLDWWAYLVGRSHSRISNMVLWLGIFLKVSIKSNVKFACSQLKEINAVKNYELKKTCNNII